MPNNAPKPFLAGRKQVSRFLAWVICSVFAGAVPAQTYTFKTYTVEDGLPRSQVLSVCQDAAGNMWYGTLGGGACRFNGKAFFTVNTRNGLLNNDVNAMLLDRSGQLWFATNGGVGKYNGYRFTNYTTRDGLCSDAIVSIMQDRKGNIWLRSLESGVSRIEAASGKVKSYTAREGLSDNVVFDMKEDHNGNMWFACFKGVNRLAVNGKITRYTTAEGLGNSQVSSVLEDTEGNIWAGTWGGGISRYVEKNGNGKFVRYEASNPALNNSIVISMLEDRKGNIWVATLGNGLLKIKNRKIFTYNTGQSLPRDFVNRIYEDHRGNIWMVTSEESLYRISVSEQSDIPSFTGYSSRNGLSDSRVKTLFEDREGNMWIGTYSGGVCRYDGELFMNITSKDGLVNPSVTSFCSSNGALWMGTDGGGISMMKEQSGEVSIRQLEDSQTFGSKFILSLHSDNKGNTWIGTNDDGLIVRSPGGVPRSYTKYNGFPHNKINKIGEDSRHQVWVCTDGGIIRFPGDENKPDFKVFSRKSGTIRLLGAAGFVEDEKGNLWFCGSDTVLEVFNGHNFSHYTVRYKLSGASEKGFNNNALLFGTEDNGVIECRLNGNKLEYRQIVSPAEISYTTVNSLVMDDEGSLWIGSSKGIFKLNYSRLDRYGIRSIKEYGKDEGLISLVTNRNAVFKDSSKKIWFGTVSGAIRVDNLKSTVNTREPLTAILDIRLFFQQANLAKYADSINPVTNLPVNLKLPYSSNHVTFDFIGVSLTSPQRVKYRYKLEGIDNGWSPVRQETFTTYSNLPPGRYTFMVMASNNDGVWNAVPARYSFIITTPYWRTWWFIALCVLALGLLLYGYYRWRISQVKHTADLRQKIVESEQKALRAQMNPHFIFNSLNSIQHFITDKDVKSANRYLSKFSKLMRLILDNSKKSVITLAEELESLKLYLDLEALRFEDKFSYQIDLPDDIDSYSIEIPPMLLQPYLENAIWHGLSYKQDKGEILISFEMEENLLICSISDNGIGRKKSQELKIAHPAQHNSSGMRITSDRLQSIGELKGIQGSVEVIDLVDSEGEGIGTMVKMKIPID